MSSSCSSCEGGGNCPPMSRDRILLRGMLFHGYHGVLAEESKLGQKFLVDVDAYVDLRSAAYSDEIGNSVSYAELYEQIKGVVEGQPVKLVETVAQLIAQAIFLSHPSITDVRVKSRVGRGDYSRLVEESVPSRFKYEEKTPWKHSNLHPELPLPNCLQLMTRSYFKSYVLYSPS